MAAKPVKPDVPKQALSDEPSQPAVSNPNANLPGADIGKQRRRHDRSDRFIIQPGDIELITVGTITTVIHPAPEPTDAGLAQPAIEQPNATLEGGSDNTRDVGHDLGIEPDSKLRPGSGEADTRQLAVLSTPPPMIDPATPLPVLPPELLRRYFCAEQTDTRFRAVARLRQSLWREAQGYPCGRYVDAHGRTRRLGSRLTNRVGRTGANLIDPALVPLVRHAVAYREVGAVIDVARLWTNLLTSQALAFSLFGPLVQQPALATAVMRRLLPDLVSAVTDVRFEHSPGRGHPGFTADHTAFDVLIRCTTPQGQRAFVAIELKYSEAPGGIASSVRPRYDTLSRAAGCFRDPDAPALRYAPIEQFWREQLLVTAMLANGLYEDGRLLVIAPALNAECQVAIARYQAELTSNDPAETRFQAITLEEFTNALGNAGADTIAERLIHRYLDFSSVHRTLAETFQGLPSAT